MRSPLLTWKPWYWLCALVVCAIVAKLVNPFVARGLFVVLACLVTWSFYELGAELFRKLGAPSSLNLSHFRSGSLYIVGYIAIIIWFPSDEFLLNNYTPAEYGWRWAILPVGLGFMYLVFYVLFFLSKATSLIRTQAGTAEPVLLNMLLYGFFPVGIFALHPRLTESLSPSQKQAEPGYPQ